MKNIEKYQSDYQGLPFECYQVQFRRRKVLESLNKYRPQHILEIGCGLEPIFKYFTNFSMMHIVEPGLDFYSNAVKEATGRDDIKIHLGSLQENIKLLEGDQFDFILMSGLLHEVENPHELLEDVKLLCSPETIIHINVPNARSFHRLLALEMSLITSIFERSPTQIKLQQPRIFDINSLINMVNDHGFTVFESGSYFFKPFTAEQMAKMVDYNIITMDILEGLYNIMKYIPEFGSEIFVNMRLN